MANKLKKTNKILFFLLFFVFFLKHTSQNRWYFHDWKHQNWPGASSLYQKTVDQIVKDFSAGSYVIDYLGQFASWQANAVCGYVESGNVYYSLQDMEPYVKKIMEAVIRDSSITNKVEIRFKASNHVGAEMHENGLLLLDVGLICKLQNEAELAMILAHEVGHYLNHDLLKKYGETLHSKQGNADNDYLKETRLNKEGNEYFHFSKGAELQADIKAMRFLNVSPYSFSAALEAYRVLEKEELRRQLRAGRPSEYWSNYPFITERIDYLNEVWVDSCSHGRKKNVVDGAAFKQLKKLCYQETVNICFLNGEFDNLITIAFSNYLRQPEVLDNLVVLTEALKRKLDSPEHGDLSSRFILDQYETAFNQKSKVYNFLTKTDRSVLFCLDKGFTDLRQEEFVAMKGELWDSSTVEFTTNAEALSYFRRIVEKEGGSPAFRNQFFDIPSDSLLAEHVPNRDKLSAANDFVDNEENQHYLQAQIVVVLPVRGFSPSPRLSPSQKDITRTTDNLAAAIEKELKGKWQVLSATKLDLSSRRKVNYLADLVSSNLAGESPQLDVRVSKSNWTIQCPENYKLFTEFGISGIYLCKVTSIGEGIMRLEFYKICHPRVQKNAQLIWSVDRQYYPNGPNSFDYASLAKEFRNFMQYYSRR